MRFNNDDRDIEADELLNILIIESLKNAVNRFGIEGTEDKIKELYYSMPEARERILKVYYETYRIRKDKN